MAIGSERVDAMPVVRNREDFDPRSGNLLERIIFNHRRKTIGLAAILTIVLGVFAARVKVDASFDKMIPQAHPYIRNYLENKGELAGLGNSIRVVVENTQGDIYDPAYLDVLRQVNDEIFLTPGVDRAWMKSLWTPSVRWNEVTEEGFRGGPVMPDSYDGTTKGIEELKANVRRSGVLGTLVAKNLKSSMLLVPLLDTNPETRQRLDYRAFSRVLEGMRTKYEADPRIKIHVIGFAKLMADLLEALSSLVLYFAAAAAVAATVIFAYTRCIRSTVIVLISSVIAVIWLVGIVSLIGNELDPFSILVPFLIFAIGVSHGAQKMNGIMQDVGRGTHKYVAARYTFRRLFLAGLTALLADAVGFAVLTTIDIPVIRSLALTASIGVALLIFTNLLFLPALLSFTGVSLAAAKRSLQEESKEGESRASLWSGLSRFTERRFAVVAIAAAMVLASVGYAVSLRLHIGDVDPGAPELRQDSRYNKDVAFVTANYALSSDQFAVIVKTPPEGCQKVETLTDIDRLGWAMRQAPGVQTTTSLADNIRLMTAGMSEGSFKWLTISRNQGFVNTAVNYASVNAPELLNKNCSVVPLIAYLADHKAETLDGVLGTVERFALAHNSERVKFLPAAGSSGIEAVTNIVVRDANRTMMLYVYLAVIVLCFITFRSWRAVVVAVVPLVITSILCEALMVKLGIGVKVATLPVIALGVGIGVDYALYLVSVQLGNQRHGMSLGDAYRNALLFTGKVVGLVGVTLAGGVVTWAWSPIKFQADMGILLTFMFLWNMVGALVLTPALSHFLLRTRTVPVTATAAVRPHAVG
jgi:predicted RND superfamily exporter protein